MYACRVERHSVSAHTNQELLTYVVTFPRIVLAEVVTHRLNSDTWADDASVCERTTTPDISKNSASSRAIPHERFIQRIKEDPYIPEWTSAAKGMQGGSDLTDEQRSNLTKQWVLARDMMIIQAEDLNKYGAHKQDSNRLLEPWAWVTQVITSSQWDNFFALRCHPAAHPAFRKIARMMFLARLDSKPEVLEYGQWHLPFVGPEVTSGFRWEPHRTQVTGVLSIPYLLQVSAARCAWVSYENHDKDGSTDAVTRTCVRLVSERPVHASPFEHQATPGIFDFRHTDEWAEKNDFSRNIHSNLKHWIQLRKLIPVEQVYKYNPTLSEVESWPEYQEWRATMASKGSTES